MDRKFQWVYKVVRKREDGFFSATMDGKLKVRYELGKESLAPVGGLLVFKTLEDATYFAYRCSIRNAAVLKARAYDPIPIQPMGAFYYEYAPLKTKRVLERLWSPRARSRGEYDWLEGSLAFRRIIPTKVVSK